MNYFSDISLWWIIPALLLSAGVSYWYYFKSTQRKDWSPRQAKVLSFLRGLGLFLLLLLLIGLVWESISYRKEKPLFVTLIDNSGSMNNYKDSAVVEQQVNAFRSQLRERFGDQFELIELAVGESVKPYTKIDFKDKQTDLSEGFDHIREVYFNRNIGGMVLISDGNFNRGTHPMYQAERIELTPVFTLGVGDTVTRRDQLIRNVNTNEVAFVNNQFPIEATIDFNKMPLGPTVVSLLYQGKVIQTQTVSCTNAFFDQQVVLFNVTAKQKGFQSFTVQVEHKKGEFTFDNNQQTCYIEVLDNKNLICLLSSAPHPDLAAIRSILEEDEQSTIDAGLIQNYAIPKQRPNLVIWYENGSKSNAALFNELKQKKIPVLLLVGASTPAAVIQSYNIGLKIPNGSQQDDVYPSVSGGFSAFSFTNQFTDAASFYPPLRTKFGTYNLPANAEILLNQRIGSIVKKDPMMYVSSVQDTRIGVVLGEGIWRWKMKEYAQKHSIEGFREFIQKTVQYLTVKQNNEPLRITLPKRFTVAEDVEVKAEFYNSAMELITTPEITLTYTKKGGRAANIAFSPLTNFYKANAGQLSAGTYSWSVVALYNGKTYKKSGEFVVEDIETESLDTRADFSVLNQLAQQSDGLFNPLKDYQKTLDYIDNRKDITTLQFADSGYTSLIDWIWIFLLLILIFGAEWFLRRWWGSY